MEIEPEYEQVQTSIEDIACSVNSEPNSYKVQIDRINKSNNFDIEKIVTEGKIIKVRTEPINEKWSWVYLGKNKFEVIKNELKEFYKIIDPERLRLNPRLIDQIRNATEEKKLSIEILQNDILNKENNTKTFAVNHWEYSEVEGWLYVINKIVEQPLYVIEAIEKYPESIEKNQLIYFRHVYIKSKIDFAKDKHLIHSVDFNRLIFSKLAKEINIKTLLYFFKLLIDELNSDNSIIDYFKTQLFQLLFNEFFEFYERGITEFNLQPFKNIESVRKQLDELESQSIEIIDQEPKAITDQPEATENKLTINQIALKHVYEGKNLTRQNSNEIAKQFGYNSGDKLYNQFSYFSSAANRKGKPTLCTPRKLKNKIEFFESVIEILPEANKQRALDELNILINYYKTEFE